MKFYEYLRSIDFKPLPKADQVKFICDSFEEGLTVPFLARYRQPQTGALQGSELRIFERSLKRYNSIETLREQCLKIIEKQPKATKTWKNSVINSFDESILKEFKKIFGSTKKTKATEARDLGLEPLANLLRTRSKKEGQKIQADLFQGLSKKEAIEAASHIIVDVISSNSELRALVKSKLERFGKLRSKLKKGAEDSREKYRDYYDFEAPIQRLKSHQFLALERGSSEKILQVQIYPDDPTRIIADLSRKLDLRSKAFYNLMTEVIETSFKKKFLPAIQRELMNHLRTKSHEDALINFENNLQALLLTPGLNIDKVLAIDPGFANGCKWSIVENTGKILDVGVLMLSNSKHWSTQADKIINLLRSCDAIAVGNGVGSHNCLDFLEFCRKNKQLNTPHIVVPEAGASVYSASDIANQELADYKVELRGAISLGRRLFKPLEEYLKIPPMSLGVGMYQHDLEESILQERLIARAKDVLHEVGVDLNKADSTSLELIAGIGKSRAKAIVDYRLINGPFKTRQQLLKVAGFGPKTYEQAAGFCRVMDSAEILDQTCVHPQDYDDCRTMLKALNCYKNRLPKSREVLETYTDWTHLSKISGLSETRLKHLKMCLVDYCMDPRDNLPQPVLRNGLKTLEDLKPGELIQGVISNVVDFGVFVDLGIQQNGLLHRSCYPNRHYETSLQVGQQIQVIVKSVDSRRQRITLDLDSSAPSL